MSTKPAGWRIQLTRAYGGDVEQVEIDSPEPTEANVVELLTNAGHKPELDDDIKIFRRVDLEAIKAEHAEEKATRERRRNPEPL